MMLKNILAFAALVVLFLFFPKYSPAQKTYSTNTAEWKKIDELLNKGLTKSALTEVNKIYVSAKKEGNDVQVIKSLLYSLNLNQDIQEESGAKNITAVENEISQSKEPAKSILLSISAGMYWNLFQQNRYKLYNRTNTLNFKKDDVETWNADDFHKKIGELFLASLKEKKIIQQTKLEQFDPILISGNVRYLRPTLYDLLAHRALEYFKSDETDVNKPAYAFEIKDEKAFAPAAEFSTHKFVLKDSASLHYYALTIFQDLLLFHAADAKQDALIDADINRIEFVKQYGIMNNKDELYIKALENITKAFPENPASANAGYLVAQEIFDKANEDNVDSIYTITRAKIIAEEVVKKFTASEGGINAKNLLNQLLHKEVNLASEKVNVPGKPFLSLVTYKNISSVNIRVIELTPEFKAMAEQNNDNNNLWKTLVSQKSVRSWRQPLPLVNDYRSHSVEIKIDPLPVGQYALLISAAEDFTLNKNPLAVQYLYVSGISYINSGQDYFILHRETGKPLAGAKVQVWNRQYNNTSSKYFLEKQELLTADKNGFFKLTGKTSIGKEKRPGGDRNMRLEITYQKDRLFLEDYQNSYRYYNSDADDDTLNINDAADTRKYEKQKAKIFLFTDRSIYRPGQLVYFKGIGVTKDLQTRGSKLLTSKDSIKVLLTDANEQKVDSGTYYLNEYGSFNGKFRLPENKLNGEFNIRVQNYNNDFTSFSVEEYKRPKFFVDFEKVKGTYRVNDTIKVAGFAKAYAGNNIDGATVKYRVTRVARFLYPWMFWRSPMPQAHPLEITNGEIKTGKDGKFTIDFEAIPDQTIDKKTDPLFDYKVEADISDINGETRSASVIIPVGYKAINLQVNVPANGLLNVDSLKEINITSKNLNGEFEPIKATINIYKLEVPARLIRPRYWSKPDQFILSREEFLQSFPNDEYNEESKKETWPKGDVLFSGTDSTKRTGNWKLETANWKQGWYVAEATAKDKYGEEVKDVKYFQLYDLKETSLPAPAYAWNVNIKDNVEPGQIAQFSSGSSANDIFLIQQVDKAVTSPHPVNNQYQFLTIDNKKKAFDFAVTEKDRGGFGVYQFFVKDNRVYTTTWNVNVPWANKELDITYETFRDKTLPGSEEKWKVKITGNKGEKVAAEMVAGMYDASLDQFKHHSWNVPDVWPDHYNYNGWASVQNFTSVQAIQKWVDDEYIQQKEKRYDELIHSTEKDRLYSRREMAGSISAVPMMRKEGIQDVVLTALQGKTAGVAIAGDTVGIINKELEKTPASIDQSQIQIRKNFNETVFFFPELRTDKDGNVEFNFTMPEALTQWKLMTLAHTKELAFGYSEKTAVTQKDLMLQPNAPRFVREGDSLVFTAKIVNLDTTQVTGQAQLQLFNAATMNPIDIPFKNKIPTQSFRAAAGQSAAVKFSIGVPFNYNNAIVYRIIAKAGNASDGEEAAIPVLTNRMLVTETLPVPVKSNETKNFTFEKLLHSGKSKTLSNHALTVEFTTNPAWYAVQALPYLMEYPYDCAEQTFNRYYANSIATKIVTSSPKIKAIFEKWKNEDTSALLSNLQKNEELKAVLLEETPWVLQAQNESEQKKNIAMLFDMVRMSHETESSLLKLKDMQSSNGGFVWFKGGPDDRYMTQYIITGIGHLKKLGVFTKEENQQLLPIINAAIPYLDKKIKEDYDNLMKYKNAKLPGGGDVGSLAVHFLYMRSFFPEYLVAKESQTAYEYYRGQAKKYWLSQSKYMQAMIALSLYRTNDNITPQAIIKSLKENSITNEETGMYWKEWNTHGYWWYQAPVESQAMMIEAFSEINKDQKVIDDLKTWLLKNKQTNNWNTTKATAEACYALLLQGTSWLAEEKNIVIKAGDVTINSKDEKQEAGTGYFKTKIDGDKILPEMANISVTLSNENGTSKVHLPTGGSGVAWGAVYWQYFEDLDKVTFSETPLKVNKKLFIEKNTDRGPVLTPIANEAGLHTEVKVGDKITVRIELRVDRDMEYVHMKDMRAGCMEPINVISAYKYQGGLGYYETTKDASTNFFFNYLNKGTYVFEYSLFVTHSGNFSNGVTSIECMYAPEFTAHSEGTRINISE